MTGIVLYGFDGSTYVRTVRMLLAEKGAHYEQVPVNVLRGEPRQPEHVARHPFGKVPVLDHDGFRIIETGAIAPYLDEVLPGPSFTPESSKDRARMRMAMGIVDSYGYGALIAVAGYHLFPDFIGGPNEEARKHAIAGSRRVLQELMKIRGGSAFIAGERPSLGDFYVAPICFLVSLTPDANEVFAVDGFAGWWEQIQAIPSYQATAPRFGCDWISAAAGCKPAKPASEVAVDFAHTAAEPPTLRGPVQPQAWSQIMSILRKNIAIALMVTMGATMAHAQTKPVAKDVVIVHGALVDGSGWRAVYDILTMDGFHVTIVQEPLTGLAEDVDATKRVIDQQEGPVILVGHSYGGSVITEAGADPKVSALVYVAALQPDKGEASGQLMSKFAAPNDAMRVSTNRATPDKKYFYIPPAKFRETYAADVPGPQAQFMADSEQQLAQKAMGAPLSVAAWHNKPSYAILTTQDRVIAPELQRWMYQRSGAKVTEVPASHAVFVSQPAAVAQVIESAAKQAN